MPAPKRVVIDPSKNHAAEELALINAVQLDLNDPYISKMTPKQQFARKCQILSDQRYMSDYTSYQADLARDRHLQDSLKKHRTIRIKRNGYLKSFQEDYSCLHPSVSQALSELDQADEDSLTKNSAKITAQNTIALWVTLSPTVGMSDDGHILDYVTKAFSKLKSGINAVYFSIEQGGKTLQEKGYHPHSHILIELDKSTVQGEVARVAKWLWNKFDCFKDPNYPNLKRYLQIARVSSNTFIKKIGYVLGLKTDDAKQPAVVIDRIWRQEKNYFDIYYTSKDGVNGYSVADFLSAYGSILEAPPFNSEGGKEEVEDSPPQPKVNKKPQSEVVSISKSRKKGRLASYITSSDS